MMRINPSLNVVKNAIDAKTPKKDYPKVTVRLTDSLQMIILDIKEYIDAKNPSAAIRFAIEMTHMLIEAKKAGKIPAIIDEGDGSEAPKITPMFK